MMGKLKQAAITWWPNKGINSLSITKGKPEHVAHLAFEAGALWLLEEAKEITYADMKCTTDERLPDMRALELLPLLKELCEDKE